MKKILVTLALTIAFVAQVGHATMVITPASGYNITWDGNEGDHFGASAPANLALASNGSTAFAESEFGSPHFTANLNDGLYGNNESWLRNIFVTYPGTPAESWFGIDLPGTSLYSLSGVAWGRDNGGEGTQHTDRWIGLYTLQFTTDASVHYGNGGTWTTIGTIEYPNSSGYAPWLRHEFAISTSGGGPIVATGFRVLLDNYNDGDQIIIDEFELYEFTAVPEPSTVLLLLVGGAIAWRKLRRS